MPASTLAYKDGPSASTVFSHFSRNERPYLAKVGGEPVSDLWYINNMERFPARAKDRRAAETGMRESPLRGQTGRTAGAPPGKHI